MERSRVVQKSRTGNPKIPPQIPENPALYPYIYQDCICTGWDLVVITDLTRSGPTLALLLPPLSNKGQFAHAWLFENLTDCREVFTQEGFLDPVKKVTSTSAPS